MSSQIQKPKRDISPTYLEVLIIRVAGQWFGLRSDRQIRLLQIGTSPLNKPADPALAQLAGLLGELGTTGLPVFDLAYLLKLPSDPAASPSGQLVQLTLNGHAFGFAIEQAQEIQRIPLTQIHQLPPLIKNLQIRPAVWAVWQRSQSELIPLLDFFFVLDKAAKQALQLGQG
jgi:hypothetical protein